MQLSIVIVNYNVKIFLEQCLHSVLKAFDDLQAEIFVIDNQSGDGSRAYLEEKFPSIQFIWNENNVGFAVANNQAIKLAKGDYILFLNPDTIVPEDCFTKCIAYFKSHNNCGALGVQMINGSGYFLKESKRSFPSPGTSIFKMLGFAKVFPQSKLFAKYYAVHLKENESGPVEVLAGACMMVSKNVLEITKGFDEHFFMYGEDIDLSYRIQQAGFENHYFSGTSIIHFKGESSQQQTEHYVRHFYGAMQLFIRKHFKKKKALFYFMNVSIKAAQFIAGQKKKLEKTTPTIKTPAIVAIVCGSQDFNEVIQFIKQQEFPWLISGRIKTRVEDSRPSLGTIGDLAKIISSQKINTILFCSIDISYKNMIRVMKENKGLNYFFHAAGSQSIAGSSS